MFRWTPTEPPARAGGGAITSTAAARTPVERLEPRHLLSAAPLTSATVGSNGMYALGDKVIISAVSGVTGLWVSDGTPAGTKRLSAGPYMESQGDIFNEDAGGPPAASSGGRLFFAGRDGALYVTGGIPGDTKLVRRFDPVGGDAGPVLSDLTAFRGGIVFSVSSSPLGEEPWVSDGTPQGTYPLSQVVPWQQPALARNFTDVNGTLFFSVAGRNLLYKSDGTASGTVPVSDRLFDFGTEPGSRDMFMSYRGRLLFAAQPQNAPGIMGLWSSDGTAAGTQPIALPRDVRVARGLVNFNGLVYFEAIDPSGVLGLWQTDGTDAGTALVKPLPGGTFGELRVVGNTLYFTGPDGHSLWKSDGTAAGTVLVKSFPPGNNGVNNLVDADGTLYFLDERRVWTSDGTDAGTVEVDTPSSPQLQSAFALVAVDGQVFFQGNGNGLWTIEPPVLPAAPAALSALTATAAYGTEVDLSWAPPGGQAGYHIDRGTDPTFSTPDWSLDLPDPTATGYADTTAAPGVTYYYRVVAYNRGGTSGPAVAQVTTPATPEAPTGLADTPFEDHVNLRWADNSANETGFIVERSLKPDFSAIEATYTLPADTTVFTDTQVQPLSEYFYRVSAVNAAGRSGATALWVVTPDKAPTALRAVGVSDTEIDLTWTVNSSTQRTFRIDRAAPGGAFQTVGYAAANGNEFDDRFLPVQSTWIYRVVEVGGYFGSSTSASATGATLITGDANGDGTVNFADLLILAQHYGLAQNATFADGDFDHDGSIGFKDLLILAQSYGRRLPALAAAARRVEPVRLS